LCDKFHEISITNFGVTANKLSYWHTEAKKTLLDEVTIIANPTVVCGIISCYFQWRPDLTLQHSWKGNCELVESNVSLLPGLWSHHPRAECLKTRIGSKQPIPLSPSLPPNCQSYFKDNPNTTLNRQAEYGIKIWTDFSSVLSQCTRLTDGQTDRQNSLR